MYFYHKIDSEDNIIIIFGRNELKHYILYKVKVWYNPIEKEYSLIMVKYIIFKERINFLPLHKSKLNEKKCLILQDN